MTKVKKMPVQKATPIAITLGFGVPATTDPHHFVVTIPRSNSGGVLVTEHLGMQMSEHHTGVIERIWLERSRWTLIRDELRRVFNARLQERNLCTSVWKIGDNLVDRLLGKELCVLAWAVEHMEHDHIPIAVRNWIALTPEERWWLFGMTAMSTGTRQDGQKGWRIALMHALGDVAQHDLTKLQSRLKVREEPVAQNPTLNLFA